MNPECHEARTRALERFVAGAAATADAHLAGCEACQAEVESWQYSAAAVRRWRVEVAPELREHTLARLRVQGEKLRQRRQAYWFLGAACVISAAVNAASFPLVWQALGLLRAWFGWPAASQTALMAAWAATPLLVVLVVLWLAQAHPLQGTLIREDFHHD